MTAYALWLDCTTTPPTATVTQVPDPLPGSNSRIGGYSTTQPTPSARCVGYVAMTDGGANLPSARWTPVF